MSITIAGRRKVAIASVALLAAGCGSGSPGTSTAASRQPQDGASAGFAYARCMRDHGVTNFPDPHVVSSPGRTAITMMVPRAFAATALFKSADKACRGILPGPPTVAQQRARAQGLLAFARCMRAHGVQGFPDPTGQGELSLQMVKAAGVDVHAPAVLAAARVCVGVSRGAITPADVARVGSGGQ
jgi:hypothetical protein